MARNRSEWEALYTAPAAVAGMVISATAQWLGLRNLTITIAMRFEEILELLKADIFEALAKKQAGSIYWYPDVIKQFQYGDSLIVEDGIRKYAVIDATKQIIKVVSLRKVVGGRIEVKLAKDDGTGILVPLTAPELTAADAYINNVFSPDDSFVAISKPADVVKYTVTAKYDALYSGADVNAGIIAALQSFKLNFGFDPLFYYSQVYEDVMAVPGMKSLDLRIDMTLDSGTVTVNDMKTERLLPAGYFNWDLASTITLTAV